jgi:hypothetical protein
VSCERRGKTAKSSGFAGEFSDQVPARHRAAELTPSTCHTAIDFIGAGASSRCGRVGSSRVAPAPRSLHNHPWQLLSHGLLASGPSPFGSFSPAAAMPTLRKADFGDRESYKWYKFEPPGAAALASARLRVAELTLLARKSAVVWDTVSFESDGFWAEWKEPCLPTAAYAWLQRNFGGICQASEWHLRKYKGKPTARCLLTSAEAEQNAQTAASSVDGGDPGGQGDLDFPACPALLLQQGSGRYADFRHHPSMSSLKSRCIPPSAFDTVSFTCFGGAARHAQRTRHVR